MNFNNGKIIVERQQKFGWGQSIIKQISSDLNKKYHGLTGYSISNLQYMRQFYIEYKDQLLLLSYALQIPWAKIFLLFRKQTN